MVLPKKLKFMYRSPPNITKLYKCSTGPPKNITLYKGQVQNKIKRFNSGIARISQKKPPPHPPIRATLPTLSAVATIDETFSLSKKRAQKNSGKGKPPPQIRAMPELKRFFCFDVVP